jgi:hypothetical protein
MTGLLICRDPQQSMRWREWLESVDCSVDHCCDGYTAEYLTLHIAYDVVVCHSEALATGVMLECNANGLEVGKSTRKIVLYRRDDPPSAETREWADVVLPCEVDKSSLLSSLSA